MNDTAHKDVPLAERSDVIEDKAQEAPVEVAQRDSEQPTGASEQGQKELKDQEKHDSRVENSFFPESEGKDFMGGMELDKMSLTSLKWMRKAGSMVIRGKTPETIDEVVREVAIYLLAHDTRKDIRERSKMFAGPLADLEIELDCIMHELPVAKSQGILMRIAERVAEETATLAIPLSDDDVEALDEGNS